MRKIPFLVLYKCPETLELMKDHHQSILLQQIAYRARRTNAFNIHGLAIGEALIGDFESIGLTKQEYRTAKKKLEKNGFATFRTTPKGTIAMITGPTVWDINPEHINTQGNTQTTLDQHTNNTYQECNKEKNEITPTTEKQEQLRKLDEQIAYRLKLMGQCIATKSGSKEFYLNQNQFNELKAQRLALME